MSGLFFSSNDLVILRLSYLEGKKLSYFSELGGFDTPLNRQSEIIIFLVVESEKNEKSAFDFFNI